jgi:acetyl esterase/lipase
MVIVDVDYRLAPVRSACEMSLRIRRLTTLVVRVRAFSALTTVLTINSEYPFPVQIWDSWAGLKWVVANADRLGVDKSRVSIGGLSAGGHLSAVLAHLARDDASVPPLKLQLLVVPAVDSRWTPLEGSADPACPYETYRSCEYAPCLPLNRMRWFSRLWLGSDPGEPTL